MLRVLLVIASVALASACANEPFDLTGLKLGSELSNVKAQGYWQCERVNLPEADTYCLSDPDHKESIAGVGAQGVLLGFYDARLTQISIYFQEYDFDTVLSALEKKYGRPDHEGRSVVYDSVGARFENYLAMWERGDSIISAQRRAGAINRSAVRYHVPDLDKKFDERRRERDQGRGSDL